MNRVALFVAAGISSLVIAPAVQAADLIVDEPAPVGVVDVSGNWAGAYVGVFAGYGWGTYEDDGPAGPDNALGGGLLGLAAGYNFAVADGIVAGVVADVAWSDISYGYSVPGTEFDFNVDWVGSLRGKLGFDGGLFLPYLTAGLAVAGTSAFYDGGMFLVDESQTHVGWTVGAGLEVAVADNVSVDLAYRYSDYGDVGYAGVTAPPYDASFTTHQITAGLNLRF